MSLFSGSGLADPDALIRSGRHSEALFVLSQRAAAEDAEALFTLAGMRWAGVGCRSDPRLGRDLYRRAAEAGHPLGGQFHTNLLASGVGGSRDWSKAMQRLRAEARTDRGRRRTYDLVRKMKLDADGGPATPFRSEVLSTSPEVRRLPALFTAEECQYLRDRAEPEYQPSVVNSASGVVRDPIRTSDGATFHWLIEDPAIHALNRRLAAASGSDYAHGEALQILRYRPGQEYRPHLDVGSDLDNPRGLTALVYLNQDYQGGETRFLETGLEIKGRKGDALVFRNIAEDGRPDARSKHAGLPLIQGTKYLASRWIRQERWVP